MSELIPVFGIIALTAIVLAGLVLTFRRYVKMRDQLMPPDAAPAPDAEAAAHAVSERHEAARPDRIAA